MGVAVMGGTAACKRIIKDTSCGRFVNFKMKIAAIGIRKFFIKTNFMIMKIPSE